MRNFAAFEAIGTTVDQSPTQAAVRNYALVATASATIAAGGSATVTVKPDANVPYVITRLFGSAKLGALLGASVAGTPLPLRADPDNAANTMAFLQNVRYEISVSGNPMQQAPRKMEHLSPADGGGWEPPAPFVAGPNSEIKVTFYNDHATASIIPAIEFEGYYDPRTV